MPRPGRPDRRAVLGSREADDEAVFAALDTRIVRRFSRFLAPYKWTLAGAVASILIFVAANVAIPSAIGFVIQETIALQAHDMRTRTAGPTTFIQFHLVVPGTMSVDEAHGICDRVEDAIEASIKGAQVTIHVEPEYKAKHKGAHEYIGEAYLIVNDLPKAEEHLAALKQICQVACEEYEDLQKAINAYRTRHAR